MLRLAALTVTALAFAAPAHAECIDDLKSVLTGSLHGGPYVMEMTSDQMNMTAEFVPPAALHSKSTVAGTEQEMTVVDGKAWMKMGGNWTPLPDTVAAQMTTAISGAAGMMDQVSAPECLGTQNFEGKDYLAFKYDFNTTGLESTSTLYVDPATKLPAIIVGSSNMGGQVTNTRSTYRYDPGITVAAPM